MFSKKLMIFLLSVTIVVSSAVFLLGAKSNISHEVQKEEKQKDWLDGPVGYIITREEEKQYKKCKTEEEKDRFIKWFWARRDTNPETFRNDFLDEFNRRVKYSNAYFRERRIEGWKTARGRVYITFGPPSREWTQNISIEMRPAIFWYYDNPPSRHLRIMEALVFAELYRDGRYFLLRPMPMDSFEYFFRRMRHRSYFEIVPDEYYRAFEEANEKAIMNPKLKIEDLSGKGTVEDVIFSGEIPFQWKVDFLPADEEKIQLNITITLQYKDISYYQKDDGYYADLQLTVKLFKGADQLAAELKDEIPIEFTEDELKVKVNENLEYNGSIIVFPGEYNIKITLHDTKSNIGKTITEKLTITDESQ